MTFSLLVTVAGWLAGWILLGRIRGCHTTFLQNRADEISIIIPARDEEQNLGVLLQSIAEQSLQPREIIVVDDCSTDGTAGIPQQYGARLICDMPLPDDGWRGKTWACHQGAQAATGALLLFLDADTSLEPDGLSQLAAQFESVRRCVVNRAVSRRAHFSRAVLGVL